MKASYLIMVTVAIVAISVFLGGCRKKQNAIVKEEAVVMKEPFPFNYAHVENEIIDTIIMGDTIEVIDSSYYKDFRYYKIKFKGVTGHIFDDIFFTIDK